MLKIRILHTLLWKRIPNRNPETAVSSLPSSSTSLSSPWAEHRISTRLRVSSSISLIRTYSLKPGSLYDWSNYWSKGIQFRSSVRQDVPYCGLFTQLGQLHTIYHIWWGKLTAKWEVKVYHLTAISVKVLQVNGRPKTVPRSNVALPWVEWHCGKHSAPGEHNVHHPPWAPWVQSHPVDLAEQHTGMVILQQRG